MSIDVLQPAENFVSQLRDPETLIVKKKKVDFVVLIMQAINCTGKTNKKSK